MPMTVWVDADACPGPVRDIILRAAYKRGVRTVFVANKPLALPESEWVSRILVGQGADVVDDAIVERVRPGDLVISQDIPLAGRLVPLGYMVISPYGTLFTADNIGERLAVRNFAQDLRDSGSHTGGPRPFGENEKRRFATAFDQALAKLGKA